jgi:hypothetical protein
MASAVKKLCSQRLLRAYARPTFVAKPQWQRLQCQQRPFSSSLLRAQDNDRSANAGAGTPGVPEGVEIEDPSTWEHHGEPMEWVEDDEKFILEEEPVDRSKLGFWAEGEEEMGPDEEFYGDDISSIGHGHLEMHRERREYARLAAWELPLLSSKFL